MMMDIGIEMKVQVGTDAAAANTGIAPRRGLGKVRHIDVGILWIQQSQKEGEVEVKKVNGKLNPADVFTKHVPGEVMWRHLKSIGFEKREGRAEVAVELVGK